MKKQGGLGIGLIVKIVVAILLFLAIYAIFFRVEFYEDAWDTITNLFDLPERDPLPWQTGNFSTRRDAFKVFNSVVEQFQKTSQATNSGGICFGGFPLISDDDFFDKGYSIRISKLENKGMTFQLTERQDTIEKQGQSAQTVYVPVGKPVLLEGYTPCVVYGSGAVPNFYNNIAFVDKNEMNIPSSNYKKSVFQIRLYQHEKIQFSLDKDAKFTKIKDFDPGDDRKHYFIFRVGNELCLIPTFSSWDGFYSDCDSPEGSPDDDPDDVNGLIDDNCLDDDGALLDRLQNNLKNYVCNNYNIESII